MYGVIDDESEPGSWAREIEFREAMHGKGVDVVNSPEHYRQGGIEAIDAIAAATAELRGIEAVCTANAIKYLWRWKRKNGTEDLRKSKWYLERLIAEVGGD